MLRLLILLPVLGIFAGDDDYDGYDTYGEERLQRYKKNKIIGAGKFGKVYEVKCQDSGN